MISALLVTAALTAGADLKAQAGPPRRVWIEFTGVCAFVRQRYGWVALFPNVKDVNQITTGGGVHPNMKPHSAYVKFWRQEQVADPLPSDCARTPQQAPQFVICELKGGNEISVRGPSTDWGLTTESSFSDGVVSVTDITDEGLIDGPTTLDNPRVTARFEVKKGSLSAFLFPYRWTFPSNPGASRVVAKSALLELGMGTADPNLPLQLSLGKGADGADRVVTLKDSFNSFQATLAQTDVDERSVAQFYGFLPPEPEDHDFLMNYALLASWTSAGASARKVECRGAGATTACPYPVLDTSAVSLPPADPGRDIKGRKTNCHVIQYPLQLQLPAAPAAEAGFVKKR